MIQASVCCCFFFNFAEFSFFVFHFWNEQHSSTISLMSTFIYQYDENGNCAYSLFSPPVWSITWTCRLQTEKKTHSNNNELINSLYFQPLFHCYFSSRSFILYHHHFDTDEFVFYFFYLVASTVQSDEVMWCDVMWWWCAAQYRRMKQNGLYMIMGPPSKQRTTEIHHIKWDIRNSDHH